MQAERSKDSRSGWSSPRSEGSFVPFEPQDNPRRSSTTKESPLSSPTRSQVSWRGQESDAFEEMKEKLTQVTVQRDALNELVNQKNNEAKLKDS